ncbi:pig-p domain-containing protein [Diplodia corticola]|uniref:Pig-p domain-containing protein n=1 Tax=Diplodia corticola TaxID=236234 RepID=A0A1J9S1V4_9PEZI|nr:pig-p domain-containing protein [Diplodia corticola]OJD38931.1 pig-p domain-containing protein [Diplodia corticola]
MPPQSRGNGLPTGFISKSTPNLPTLSSLNSDLPPASNPPSAKTDAPSNPLSPTDTNTSPSEAASVEDNLSTEDLFTFDDASGTSSASDDDFDLDFDDDTANLGGGGGGGDGGAGMRSTSTDGNERPRRPLYSHASRSHSALPQTSSALFPPFYNRPPTPLPPSPSLTSLLRPSSFSAQTSRPTTPDSSDVEGMPSSAAAGSRRAASAADAGGADPGIRRAPSATSAMSASGTSGGTGTSTPTGGGATMTSGGGVGVGVGGSSSSNNNSMATAFAAATLVPRASPKVPTYEYYGFFIYLASSFAFLMYLLWAYLPRPFLHQLGIYYYPNRWWALAVPAWLVALVVYIYVALASYNLGYLTLPMGSTENIVDDAAQIATLDSRGRVVRKGKGGKVEKVPVSKGAAGGRHSRDGSVRDAKGGAGYAVESGTIVDWKTIWGESTDAVLDVPVGGVCEILYGDGRETDDDEGEMNGEVNGAL